MKSCCDRDYDCAVDGPPTTIEQTVRPSDEVDSLATGRGVLVASIASLVVAILVGVVLARPRSDELTPFARAVAASAADRSYQVDQVTQLTDRSNEAHAIVDGSKMFFENPDDETMDAMYVDGDRAIFHSTVGWQEWLMPGNDRGKGHDNIWADLIDIEAIEITREGTRITYEARCPDAKGYAERVGGICNPRPAAAITVVVDERTNRIVELHIEGEIPLYPGKWETGSFDLQFRHDVEMRFVVPAEVDATGLWCLANEFDMTRIDRAALRARIANWTTEELRELFVERCGFERWPAGVDFGKN